METSSKGCGCPAGGIFVDGLLALAQYEEYIPYMDEETIVYILWGGYRITPEDVAFWEVARRADGRAKVAERIEKALSDTKKTAEKPQAKNGRTF